VDWNRNPDGTYGTISDETHTWRDAKLTVERLNQTSPYLGADYKFVDV